MPRTDTRERLLNAAEELIARKGYSGTSLRDITGRARANLAAVHYHFGSKEGLADAVLKRHLVPLNHERLTLLKAELAEAEEKGRPPDPEILMRILIGSILRHVQNGDRGKHFIRISGRLHTDPDETLRGLFMKAIQEIWNVFTKAFLKALPELPPELLLARLAFAFGAMGYAAKLVTDSDFAKQAGVLGLSSLPNHDVIVDELIGFVTQGMKMPCAQTKRLSN